MEPIEDELIKYLNNLKTENENHNSTIDQCIDTISKYFKDKLYVTSQRGDRFQFILSPILYYEFIEACTNSSNLKELSVKGISIDSHTIGIDIIPDATGDYLKSVSEQNGIVIFVPANSGNDYILPKQKKIIHAESSIIKKARNFFKKK